MAQMALPTKKQKAAQVEKATRLYDSLKTRHDNAKAIVDEVAPGLAKAKAYLDYLQGMPVADADETPADQGQPEAQPTLFSEQSNGENNEVFA
jgi:hypothetical protein